MANLTDADKQEIQELVARYCWAIDTGDAEAYANTFTPDGVFERGGGQRVEGREALAGIVPTLSSRPWARQHWVTNLLIEGDAERASSRSYIIVNRIDDGVIKQSLMASYEDELLRLDGRWLFSRRRVVSWPAGPEEHK